MQGNSALLYRTVHLICIQLLLRNAHSSRYDPDAAQEIELRGPSDLLYSTVHLICVMQSWARANNFASRQQQRDYRRQPNGA